MTPVPGPRFRDQLAERAEEIVRRWSSWAVETQAAMNRPGIEGDRAFLLAYLRRQSAAAFCDPAEVEARVQAAANQRAVDLEALARRFEHLARHHHSQAADTQPVKALSAKHRGLAVAYTAAAEDLAAALASPAPALDAEEGQ